MKTLLWYIIFYWQIIILLFIWEIRYMYHVMFVRRLLFCEQSGSSYWRLSIRGFACETCNPCDLAGTLSLWYRGQWRRVWRRLAGCSGHPLGEFYDVKLEAAFSCRDLASEFFSTQMLYKEHFDKSHFNKLFCLPQALQYEIRKWRLA